MPLIRAHDVNSTAKTRSEDVALKEDVTFESLLLTPTVLKGLHRAGYVRPSPIQLQAIPLGRCGIDMIAQAKSGTGKTCVFVVIILEGLYFDVNGTQALVLAPTREIASQIHDVFLTIGACVKGLKCAALVGGTKYTDNKRVLKTNNHVAVGTPGRIMQLIKENVFDTRSVAMFVLDEADKLMDAYFKHDIGEIHALLPSRMQFMVFSATFPESLAKSLNKYMNNPVHVRLSADNPSLVGVQQYTHVLKTTNETSSFDIKLRATRTILTNVPFQQCIVFTNSFSQGAKIAEILGAEGLSIEYISGQMKQNERFDVIKRTRTMDLRVLVSTDLTSRGVDLENVNLVINFDIPRTADTYMHRVGRSGRFGSGGVAVTMVMESDVEVWSNLCLTYEFKTRMLGGDTTTTLIAAIQAVNSSSVSAAEEKDEENVMGRGKPVDVGESSGVVEPNADVFSVENQLRNNMNVSILKQSQQNGIVVHDIDIYGLAGVNSSEKQTELIQAEHSAMSRSSEKEPIEAVGDVINKTSTGVSTDADLSVSANRNVIVDDASTGDPMLVSAGKSQESICSSASDDLLPVCSTIPTETGVHTATGTSTPSQEKNTMIDIESHEITHMDTFDLSANMNTGESDYGEDVNVSVHPPALVQSDTSIIEGSKSEGRSFTNFRIKDALVSDIYNKEGSTCIHKNRYSNNKTVRGGRWSRSASHTRNISSNDDTGPSVSDTESIIGPWIVVEPTPTSSQSQLPTHPSPYAFDSRRKVFNGLHHDSSQQSCDTDGGQVCIGQDLLPSHVQQRKNTQYDMRSCNQIHQHTLHKGPSDVRVVDAFEQTDDSSDREIWERFDEGTMSQHSNSQKHNDTTIHSQLCVSPNNLDNMVSIQSPHTCEKRVDSQLPHMGYSKEPYTPSHMHSDYRHMPHASIQHVLTTTPSYCTRNRQAQSTCHSVPWHIPLPFFECQNCTHRPGYHCRNTTHRGRVKKRLRLNSTSIHDQQNPVVSPDAITYPFIESLCICGGWRVR